MRKICLLFLCCAILSVCVSACNAKPAPSMIKSQRRFAQYVEPQQEKHAGVVDLSEGPKLKYEANFGPKNPEFDFKIKNPY